MAGRLRGSARLGLSMASWVLIALALRVDLWLGVLVAVLLVGFCSTWLRRAGGPGQTWFSAILQIAIWAAFSILAWIALYVVALVVATAGAEAGLWGSPWDGR
jgi:hypothetical protein